MSQFAFRVSWQDLIRKIGYRYEHPADYISSLLGKFYDPGARVDITVNPSTIEVKSDSPTNALIFDQALEGSPLESTFVIPPVSEYAAVRILSGRRGIVVDAQRTIHRSDPDEYYHGTIITILRDQTGKDGDRQHRDDAEISGRLERLYWGSDLRVTINGRALYTQAYTFKTGFMDGAVTYDPTNEGGIRYYTQGRFIEREPLMDGVNVLVHRHSFRTTLTNSHLIKSGDEQLQIQRQLPDIMAGYLESPQILELAKRNLHSSRVLCQTILARLPEDERLQSLADRLAHPERARGTGLASFGGGDSSAPAARSTVGRSTHRPHPGVMVLILCALMALCVGVWRYSAPNQPPSAAQTAPKPAERPGDSGSTSSSNPKPSAPAPVAPPVDSASTSPPNPRPSAPAPVESSRDGMSAAPSAPQHPAPVVPPGDGVSPSPSSYDAITVSPAPALAGSYEAGNGRPISVRTGAGFMTPPVPRVSGPEPGLNYSTTNALAEDLGRMEEDAEKRGTSREGYIPVNAYNTLTMSAGHLQWSARPPYDTLFDTVQRPVWSPEFARVVGHADGIREVRSYLDGFRYGAIPPDVGRGYPDDLSAMLRERKVDCVASNTLAAHLLFELGYRKVLAITGTRGGGLHMWLNVWEDGQWHIEDFTPARISPDLARILPPSQAHAYLGDSDGRTNASGRQDYSSVPASQAQHYSDDSDRLMSASGTQSSLDGPVERLTRVIFAEICILSFVICLTYSVVSFRLRKRANTTAIAADQWAAAAETVRDLLGVAAVKTGSEAAYDRRTGTLTLSVVDLSGDGPFASAVKAVPLVSRSEAQQQALYQRLGDRALR